MQSVLKLVGGLVDLALSLVWRTRLLASGIYYILSNCARLSISLSPFTIRVIQYSTENILFSAQSAQKNLGKSRLIREAEMTASEVNKAFSILIAHRTHKLKARALTVR